MLRLVRERAPSCASLRILLVIVACGLWACGDRHVIAPTRGRIAIASGDAQRGTPGERLDLPIVIVVRDASDAPVAGVRVTWIAEDGGAIDPAASVTDESGSAAATWTLGAGGREHHGRAAAAEYDPVEFVASASRQGELPLDVIQPLALETYDGSGQTVHPDFVETGPEWTHAGAYLFVTPYPHGDSHFENPSLYASDDLLRWSAPFSVTNPIFSPAQGYYSDPDAVYVPERSELWLYFRQVTDENVIRLTTSRDGIDWSTPSVVAHAPNHEIISPTVVRRRPNDWLMWAINGNWGCTGSTATVELRRSTNGVDWSKPQPLVLSQPGLFPWHIDVEWIPSRGEFWALYNTKTPGSCTTAAVYLATSRDGVEWKTYPSPVLARGAIPELHDVVYRSSLAYDALDDEVTIWYSGARYTAGNYHWRSAVQRRRRADLFATINAPSRAALAADRSLPPLKNFP